MQADEYLQPEEVPVDENDPRKADHALVYEFQASLRFRESQGDFAGHYLFEEMLKLPPSRRLDLIETAWASVATLGPYRNSLGKDELYPVATNRLRN